MANLLAQTSKATPRLLKNSNTFVAFGIISKPLSYVVTQSGRHIMALPPVVQDRNKLIWNKNDFLYAPSHPLYDLRFCTTNAPNPVPSSPDQSPTRKTVEKVFFRVVAFFWDCGGIILGWSREMFKTHVIDVPVVQSYWKRFLEKMEQSKKGF